MTASLFSKVFLANCLVIIGFNLLMLSPELKAFLLASDHRIVIGLVVYTFQFVMTGFMLRKHIYLLTDPFKGKFVPIGILIFLFVMALTAIFVNMLDKGASIDYEQDQWTRFGYIFLFNSLPGALMEEWLFRYFPVRLASTGKLKMPANMFFLVILLLFTLSHVPAYLFQYNNK